MRTFSREAKDDSNITQEHGSLRSEILRVRIEEALECGSGSTATRELALEGLRRLSARGVDRICITDIFPADSEWVGPIGSAVQAFLQDVQRVRLFTRSQYEQLWANLLDAVHRIKASAEDLQHLTGTEDAYQRHKNRLSMCRNSLETLAQVLVKLDDFSRHNVACCAQLALLADNPRRMPDGNYSDGTFATYISAAEISLIGNMKMDPLILGLSDGFEVLRLAESDANTAASAGACDKSSMKARWVAPKKFRRVTRKFWLLPRDVVRFKAQVLQHLPVLIYGDRQKLSEVDTSVLPFLTPSDIEDGAPVSSVYLDSLPELPSYHARLRRDDKATAVRVRWYGNRDPPNPKQQLFIERKVHREAFTNEWSTKERAPLLQRDALAFLSLDDNTAGLPEKMDVDGSDRDFLVDVREHIHEQKQIPFLRTSYRRTAFQLSTDNIVRISLDTNLLMAREVHPFWEDSMPSKRKSSRGEECPEKSTMRSRSSVEMHALSGGVPFIHEQKGLKDWCRSSLDVVCPGTGTRPLSACAMDPRDIVHFPYAVVEIKLQAKPPKWLKEIVKSGLLLPVPKFSKFQHGTAILYQPLTENVPYWFMPDQVRRDVLTPASWDEMKDQTDPFLKDRIADWLFPVVEEAPESKGGTSVADERNSPHLDNDKRDCSASRQQLVDGERLTPKATPIFSSRHRFNLIAMLHRSSTALKPGAFSKEALPHSLSEEATGRVRSARCEVVSVQETEGNRLGSTDTNTYLHYIPQQQAEEKIAEEATSCIHEAMHLVKLPTTPAVLPSLERMGSDDCGGSSSPEERGSLNASHGDGISSGLRSAGTPSGSERGLRNLTPGSSTPVADSGDDLEAGLCKSSSSSTILHHTQDRYESDMNCHMVGNVIDAAAGTGPDAHLENIQFHNSCPSPLPEKESEETGEIQGGSPQSAITFGAVPAIPSNTLSYSTPPASGELPSSTNRVSTSNIFIPETRLYRPREQQGAPVSDAGQNNNSGSMMFNGPVDPRSFSVMQYSMEMPGGPEASYGPGDGNQGENIRRYSTGRSKALVRTRVEPKTFFANERTFLQWLNISVLVMFLALSLLSGSTLTSLTTPSSNGATFETYSNGTETGDSASSNSRCAPGDKGCFAARLSGALIAPVALAFMAYALLIYKKRTVQILRRETVRYDDQRGPVVLVVVLIAVMIISYVISLIYVF